MINTIQDLKTEFIKAIEIIKEAKTEMKMELNSSRILIRKLRVTSPAKWIK